MLGKKVRITIDRCHVMKNFQEHLTAARREIQRHLGQEEAKALKGTRWLWLTNQENLSVEEQVELAALGEQFPVLKHLREQRDKLRALFGKSLDRYGDRWGRATTRLDRGGPAVGPKGFGVVL